MSAGKLSPEEIMEKINSFTDENEIIARSHPVEENNLVASFAAHGNYNHSEESQSRRHSNWRVMKEHEPAWKKKRQIKMFCLWLNSAFEKKLWYVKEMNEKIKRAHKKKNVVRCSTIRMEVMEMLMQTTDQCNQPGVGWFSKQASHSVKLKGNDFWNRKLKIENPFRGNSSGKLRHGREKDGNKRSKFFLIARKTTWFLGGLSNKMEQVLTSPFNNLFRICCAVFWSKKFICFINFFMLSWIKLSSDGEYRGWVLRLCNWLKRSCGDAVDGWSS